MQGGSEGLAGATDAGWAQPIGAAVLGIRHMGMSGWEPAECIAVENELAAWQKAANFATQTNALRYYQCGCLVNRVASQQLAGWSVQAS